MPWTAGRAVQQAGPVFTVQWFPSRGAPLDGSQGSSSRFWRASGATASLGLHLGIESPAGPEGRAGLPSPPGTSVASGGCQCAGRPSCPGFWAAHISRKPADAVPPRQSQASLCDMCLLVGAGIHPWAQGFFHPSAPTLLSTGAGWRGREEGTAPGAEGTPLGSPAPLRQMGASRAHDKYQQHEAPSGPLRVSAESGGRGWRGQPSCSGLVLVSRALRVGRPHSQEDGGGGGGWMPRNISCRGETVLCAQLSLPATLAFPPVCPPAGSGGCPLVVPGENPQSVVLDGSAAAATTCRAAGRPRPAGLG